MIFFDDFDEARRANDANKIVYVVFEWIFCVGFCYIALVNVYGRGAVLK